MRHLTLFSIGSAVVLATAPGLRAQESLKDHLRDAAHDAKEALKSVGQAAHEGWRQTKAYASEDPAIYRPGLRQRLDDLNADIAALHRDAADVKGHAYFLTRINALDQQYQEAVVDLDSLPPEAFRHRDNPARRDLNDLVGRLEEYVSMAQAEERELQLEQ